MQDPAIAHQQPPGRMGDDLPEWRDAILQGHVRTPSTSGRSRQTG
jgi:hypothetical protein